MRCVLLSGGIDSIALTFWVRPEIAVTVDYGQLAAEAEIQAAHRVCSELNIQHQVLDADLSALGSGDMSGSEELDIAPVPEWWPFRNQMLLTLSAMSVIREGVSTLLIGSVRTDAKHADGTAAFFTAASALMELQEGKMRVEAPAIELTSEELINTSKVPREILAWAHSCHTGCLACGSCGGCTKHFSVMENIYREAY